MKLDISVTVGDTQSILLAAHSYKAASAVSSRECLWAVLVLILKI